MKRVVLRIGCGAVCAALALTLGCGCALLPPATGVPGAASSAVSVPTDDSGKPLYDPAVLNDDRLRVLYCYDRAGSSTTILCGSTPLHQAARSENVSLVEDSATGIADYWLRSWSDPTGRGGRRTALYDKTGTEVMSFEGEQNATLQNGLLVLQESRLVDGGYVPESGYGTCQVIDLATGAALPVPEGAYSCTLCGDKLVFSCYARPEGLDDYDWDMDYQQNRWVVVQEKDSTPVYRADAASAYRLFYDSDTLSDWVELDVATGAETTATRLYGPQGLVSDLTALQGKYSYVNYLTTDPDGRPMFYGSRSAVGSAYGNVCDVLDADGKVVLQGLASCAGYYSNSLNALPDHVFAAQRGFYVGWMDTSGNWLYCQSIFSSATADDEPSYGY